MKGATRTQKLHKRLYLKNENEVGVLAEQINRMLDELSEMTHTILRNNSNMYELDLARKRAELSALQSQINPHFLYNTLDCIKGYGYLLESGEIVQSRFARPDHALLHQGARHRRPSDRSASSGSISIISIRFDNRFAFEIDIQKAFRL